MITCRPLNTYVADGVERGIAPFSAKAEKQRITIHIAATADAVMLPLAFIVKVGHNRADQRMTRVVKALNRELGLTNVSGWVEGLYDKVIKVKVKGAGPGLRNVRFRRVYIRNAKTGHVVWGQCKAWMDTCGMFMWHDLIVLPWIARQRAAEEAAALVAVSDNSILRSLAIARDDATAQLAHQSAQLAALRDILSRRYLPTPQQRDQLHTVEAAQDAARSAAEAAAKTFTSVATLLIEAARAAGTLAPVADFAVVLDNFSSHTNEEYRPMPRDATRQVSSLPKTVPGQYTSTTCLQTAPTSTSRLTWVSCRTSRRPFAPRQCETFTTTCRTYGASRSQRATTRTRRACPSPHQRRGSLTSSHSRATSSRRAPSRSRSSRPA